MRAGRRALLTAVVLLTGSIALVFTLRHRGAPIAELIAHAPRQRLIEPRLSGFRWAPLRTPSRGATQRDTSQLKLAGVVGGVLERTDDAHARGVAYLLIDRNSDAVTTLESETSSVDARLWNDLGAAHLSVSGERPSELPLALAAVDRALRLDGELAEARFNRALILERMSLSDEPRQAWREYLDRDRAGDGWTAEAREHLRGLRSPPAAFDADALQHAAGRAAAVRRFPQEARTWGEGPALAGWADGKQDLEAVRAVASALREGSGERLLDDAVAAIDRAKGGARSGLAEAHRVYRAARIDYSKRSASRAEPQFRRAAELFRRGGSAMENVAAYFAAASAFDQNRPAAADLELEQLLARIDPAHRALAAQIHWERALIANHAGDPGRAVREADAASAIFHAIGERANGAMVDGIGALALELIGERDAAWTRRMRALGALSEPARRAAILRGAAMAAVVGGRADGALALLDVALVNRRDDDPAPLCANLAERARLAERAGDSASARQSLAGARAAAARIGDAALHETMMAKIDLADPGTSIAGLDRVIASLSRGQAGLFLPEAYLQRARAHRAAGDDAGAAADYEAALEQIEARKAADAGGDPLGFLDVATQVIEESVDLQLGRGRTAEAFAIAARTAAPAAPPRTAIILYSLLPHDVALFCITGSGLTAQRVRIERRALDARIEALAEALRLRAPIGETQARAEALHRILIAPLRERLAGIDALAIVADRELNDVPFAALWNGRYLVEDYTIRFAPGLTAVPPVHGALSPALVVADPPAPPAPRLPSSRVEAQSIAELHGAELLDGAEATKGRFIEAARRSALIHYAGHANSDASSSYGALLFADDLLSSSEIARLTLTRQPLVVLAACGTSRGKTHVAGMSSLARSFLTAGARSVIGTLWEIDDDVSATLFSGFHQHLHRGASPPAALRAAQLELAQSGNPRLSHPASWASALAISPMQEP